jgi:hypothetical protein
MRGFTSAGNVASSKVTDISPARESAAAAEYIADLAESLARTARENGLSILAHLLEMAREEAAATAASAAQTPVQPD